MITSSDANDQIKKNAYAMISLRGGDLRQARGKAEMLLKSIRPEPEYRKAVPHVERAISGIDDGIKTKADYLAIRKSFLAAQRALQRAATRAKASIQSTREGRIVWTQKNKSTTVGKAGGWRFAVVQVGSSPPRGRAKSPSGEEKSFGGQRDLDRAKQVIEQWFRSQESASVSAREADNSLLHQAGNYMNQAAIAFENNEDPRSTQGPQAFVNAAWDWVKRWEKGKKSETGQGNNLPQNIVNQMNSALQAAYGRKGRKAGIRSAKASARMLKQYRESVRMGESMKEGLIAKRISQYDVVVKGPGAGRFAQALKRSGLRSWKLGNGAYQISFSGHPDKVAELPSVGSSWSLRSRSMGSVQEAGRSLQALLDLKTRAATKDTYKVKPQDAWRMVKREHPDMGSLFGRMNRAVGFEKWDELDRLIDQAIAKVRAGSSEAGLGTPLLAQAGEETQEMTNAIRLATGGTEIEPDEGVIEDDDPGDNTVKGAVLEYVREGIAKGLDRRTHERLRTKPGDGRTRSRGHLAFIGAFEYFVVKERFIYRAKRNTGYYDSATGYKVNGRDVGPVRLFTADVAARHGFTPAQIETIGFPKRESRSSEGGEGFVRQAAVFARSGQTDLARQYIEKAKRAGVRDNRLDSALDLMEQGKSSSAVIVLKRILSQPIRRESRSSEGRDDHQIKFRGSNRKDQKGAAQSYYKKSRAAGLNPTMKGLMVVIPSSDKATMNRLDRILDDVYDEGYYDRGIMAQHRTPRGFK